MRLVHLRSETVDTASSATVTARAAAPGEGQTRRERRAGVEVVAPPVEERARLQAPDLAYHHTEEEAVGHHPGVPRQVPTTPVILGRPVEKSAGAPTAPR